MRGLGAENSSPSPVSVSVCALLETRTWAGLGWAQANQGPLELRCEDPSPKVNMRFSPSREEAVRPCFRARRLLTASGLLSESWS